MQDVFPIILAMLSLYLLLSGIYQIIRRKNKTRRWYRGPPRYSVAEETDRPAWQVVLSGIIRLAIGAALAIFVLRSRG